MEKKMKMVFSMQETRWSNSERAGPKPSNYVLF